MLPVKWHRYIFLFGLVSLAAGMLFGTVSTSIPEFILFGNWLLEGRFKEKGQLLKNNPVFWVLSSVFAMHLLGLAYTHNMQQGFNDIRNKIPLELIPLVLFSTKPIDAKEFRMLFGIFLLSVLISSICCFIVYLGYTKKVITDPRQASVFMSHIRFSLFIVFAIVCCVYFFFREKVQLKIPLLALGAWLLWYLYKLEMATGFVCLCVVSFIMLVAYAYIKVNKWVGLAMLVLMLLPVGLMLGHLKSDSLLFEKSAGAPANILRSKTLNGSDYLQDTLFDLAENGNLITINISDAELRRNWPARSRLPYDSLDGSKNELRFTILRYLSSKGLTKDSAGLAALSASDIHNIETGITNFKYPMAAGLKARWRELIWEYTKYLRGENPSGHTLTMRLEFWKTSLYIIHRHLLLGVGTGDIQDEFNKAYMETDSKLDPHWRLRNHNQYLAITVAFGLLGLIVFLVYLVYPARRLWRQLHPLYWPFFIISVLSFMTEDTLETQSGVTFFIFYNAFFLWLASFKHGDHLPEGGQLNP